VTTSAEQYIDPYEDLRARFRPSRTAIEIAVAALAGDPEAEAAIVPMYMPGKRYNEWEVGQRVESVKLALLGFPASQVAERPTLQDRRQEAYDLASAALAAIGSGTTAYAIVGRDGTAMVFEEILSAR
jgi:hypothetical protein